MALDLKLMVVVVAVVVVAMVEPVTATTAIQPLVLMNSMTFG